MGRIVGNGRGGVSKTPNHTTLEPLYYPVVQQCTTPYITPHRSRRMCMKKRVQMTQTKKLNVNLSIFGRLIY